MVVSFYKMFGYPTGVGALVIKKSFLELLSRTRPWFAGGSVDIVQVPGNIVTFAEEVHERFEVCTQLGFYEMISYFELCIIGRDYQLPLSSSHNTRTCFPRPTVVGPARSPRISYNLANRHYFLFTTPFN